MTRSDRLVFALGAVLLGLPIGLGLTCNNDEIEWVRFNADDHIDVSVTSSDSLGDPIGTELHSSSGAIVVGVAALDPGSGPVGTDHLLAVVVDDEYQEVVGRVSLAVDSGDRGVAEFELSQDSADHGYWWVDMRSVGENGETRTDRFEIRLWEEDTDGGEDDTGDDDTADDTGDSDTEDTSDTSDTSDTGT